jgi:hypothetical protein
MMGVCTNHRTAYHDHVAVIVIVVMSMCELLISVGGTDIACSFIFKGSGGGTAYGPTFTTGDVIGCCVNFHSGTVFYTKNGLRLCMYKRE